MASVATLRLRGEDQPRVVKFDINALDDVERYLGAEVREAYRDGTIALKIRATRALLWGGLKHADPTLTPPAVGDLMQRHLDAGGALHEIYEAISEALIGAGVVRAPGEGVGGNAPTPAPPAAA